MPILSPSTSSSTTASSTAPHSQKLGGKSSPKKSIRSSSWSAWLSASVFRNTEAQGDSVSKVDGPNDESVAKANPGGKANISEKVDLHKPGQSDEHKKCVTIEEPHEETANGAESDAQSDAGTVRRPKIPSSNIPPQFLLSPEPFDNHRSLSLNDIDHLHQEHQHESHSPHHHHHRQREDRIRQVPGPRRTSQTVSRDDYLMARGANPRTGVVSPAITDESHSDDLGPRVENPGGAMNNQKWRLKGDQWISLDASERTPLPTPSPDADAGVPLKNLEDRFVVNMPSAREPCPPTMTPRQIADFQQACNRFYRYENDMTDAERAPSPRSMTPEGPSTPPRKLSKIREALLQSTGPLERGRRRDKPFVPSHNPHPQNGPRQWRHSSAPPGGLPRRGWREQTNKSFLEGGQVCGEERPLLLQKMRRHPPVADQYRPTGHYSQRGPQEIPYRSRHGPGMPGYPQELHPRFRSSGPAGNQNLDSIQDRKVSRDIYFEPQSQAKQTIQLGTSDGDDLLATITTTTTTSTVTPVRLKPSDLESYFTPTEATSQKSSSGHSHRASGESIATTVTKAGSVVSVENTENTGGINQSTAIHVIKLGQNTQRVDGLTHILGTQGGETRDRNECGANWLIAQATSFTKQHLIPIAVFYLTLAAMTYREYHQYLVSRIPPGLNTPQGLRSMQAIAIVLFVSVAISLTPRALAKAFFSALQDMI